MTPAEIFMILGFLLAAYSIVANDAIQTLGTFLASNAHRPWWVLWLFASGILTAVLLYTFIANNGDPAYGRLEKFPKPEGGITWVHLIPPLVILILTRLGAPVSTTFLILTVFAPGNLWGMLQKSLMGYVVALMVGFLVVRWITQSLEKRFQETADVRPSSRWVVLQWISTAWLWGNWLIQDLANIFVYLPRTLNWTMMLFALAVMLVLHAAIFYQRGGKIQKVVTSKTNTQDIRSATLVDFLFGCILYFFKELSNLPMSTTWVFLGLLAGRELALRLVLQHRSLPTVLRSCGMDAGKALAGLAISVILAMTLSHLS